MKKISDTAQLREFLSEQMHAIVDGTLDKDKARGVANLSQQIYNTLNLELRHATLVANSPDIKVKPIEFK